MSRGRPVKYKQILKGDGLSKAIKNELTIYSEEVVERLNEAGAEATKELVKRTKATAPVGTGDFKKRITRSEESVGNGLKRHIWHVKAPDHRLTHLLVHGHAKAGGGRVEGNPFLKNALDQVLPEFERKVEEALQYD